MTALIEKHIATEDGENTFQLRLNKTEGVGLATTPSGKSYLLLDSLEYWYDLIQDGYPKKKKCGCTNNWFSLIFAYEPREGTDDIRGVDVRASCTACGKKSIALSVDVDVSPTQHLLQNPLTLCEKPNIKYKLSKLSSYWSRADLQDFLTHMLQTLGLHGYCWYWDDPGPKRRLVLLTAAQAAEVAGRNNLGFYFSLQPLERSLMVLDEQDNGKGVYLRQGLWRRHELVELSGGFSMAGVGTGYFIEFCTQYLDQGQAVDKSAAFTQMTAGLKTWLAQRFVTARGKNCFDGHTFVPKWKEKGYIREPSPSA